ncbi:MAG: WD40 repeat domain-containing protein [Armatimonadota bacterium]|nr:WD40 repeat domain-containing protein [Armatimonadota bacterium]
MILTSLLVTAAAGQVAYGLTPAGAMLGQEAFAFAAAPTGTLFAASLADRTVRIIDAKTRMTKLIFTGHNFPCRAVAWSPKGDRVATGSENAEIRIWNVKSGAVINTIKGAHIRSINALWFDSTGTKLVSTSDDDTSKVWDLANMSKPLVTIAGKGANIYGTRYAKGGRMVAGTLANGVIVYNATSYLPAFTLGGHPGFGVNDVDTNVTGTRLLSAGRDGALGVWDLQKKTRISYLRGHGDWVTKVLFHPAGQFALSSSTDGSVQVWDTKGLTRLVKLEGMSYMGSPIAWVANGAYVVGCGDDNFIRIYKFGKIAAKAN